MCRSASACNRPGQPAHGPRSASDRALALVLFDKLMTEHAVTPFLQPIVEMKDRRTVAYEVLARSRLFGLEMPRDMFGVAQQLNLEVELSTMLRWEGVQVDAEHAAAAALVSQHASPRVARSEARPVAGALRENWPDQALTLEIHEAAVTKGARLAELRLLLKRLDIKLAYDDFGVGESRLNELAEVAPDYVKFDMSLIRDIDSATPQRQQVVASLVQMVRNLGITSLGRGRGNGRRGRDLPADGLRSGSRLSLRPPRPAAEFLDVTPAASSRP